MNKVILMGRLTRDPEVRYTTNSQQMAVARYTMAVNRSYKREGEADADFINIAAFGKRGEFASKYFRTLTELMSDCSTYEERVLIEVLISTKQSLRDNRSFINRRR